MFSKDDLLKYAAFKRVVQQGDFNVKGEAIQMVASLLKWFEEIEGKIKSDIDSKQAIITAEKKEPVINTIKKM